MSAYIIRCLAAAALGAAVLVSAAPPASAAVLVSAAPLASAAVLVSAAPLASAAVLVSAAPLASAAKARQPAPIAAVAAELANGKTGHQLWGRRQYTPRPIASLTKVMTALVVLKAGHLGRYIKITQADVDYVTSNGTSSAGLHAGDVITARQLLYAMLLPSGADAARALAVRYGPGLPAFIAKMNAQARRLRLPGTHFTNFDGLQSTDVSTPRNLLLLGEAAMRLPAFRNVVKRRWHWLPAGRLHHSYLWRNTNLLLGRYPGVIGIKTGWTPSAGECVLFEAVHGKRVLIGVALDSAPVKNGQSFKDAITMLNWGFGLHRAVTLPPPADQRRAD
jgi:serine-type D-Ala-D-Ala carboxypeptidase (penicillin-binding protein 5/6)